MRGDRCEYRIPEDKQQRILKAWDYGVEPEHIEERFGVSRGALYSILEKKRPDAPRLDTHPDRKVEFKTYRCRNGYWGGYAAYRDGNR